jgi:hypothetical protein
MFRRYEKVIEPEGKNGEIRLMFDILLMMGRKVIFVRRERNFLISMVSHSRTL